jgi:hypothetical protein
VLGRVAFEYSAFAVDGRADLTLVIYNPLTPADAEKITSLTGLQAAPADRSARASCTGEPVGEIDAIDQ